MKSVCIYRLSIISLLAAIFAATLCVAPVRAEGIALPPEALQGMDKMYGGDPDAAIVIAHDMEQARPDHPLGYLLEAEAIWWKRYCAACEIKYGMVDLWRRNRDSDDIEYLKLTDDVIRLAQAQLAKSETAEMHTYAGLGWALKVRIYALRAEYRNAARTAVSGRTEMLAALKLDPDMADATAALGIYNYYVDAVSPIVKLLRIFMGIPGGDKQTGVKQMEVGMNQGLFLAVDVRFVLARALRTYDQKYQQALTVAEPLVTRYPHNPMFLLVLGNLNAELGRKDKASDYFHAALATSVPDDACATRSRELANAFLASQK
jgi:tetratricopeptide (TPR) repeat protein